MHVKEVKKRGKQLKVGDKEHNLSDLDTRKAEITEELKRVEYKHLEDMVYRMELTSNKVVDILVVKRLLDQLLDIHYHREYMKALILT